MTFHADQYETLKPWATLRNSPLHWCKKVQYLYIQFIKTKFNLIEQLAPSKANAVENTDNISSSFWIWTGNSYVTEHVEAVGKHLPPFTVMLEIYFHTWVNT